MVDKVIENESIDGSKADDVNKALEEGYTADSADALAENKKKRRILKQNDGDMTDEQKKEYMKTRESDKYIIENDWKENQPEKYAFHYVKNLYRIRNKLDNAKTDDERQKYQDEYNRYMAENKDWVMANKDVVVAAINKINEVKNEDNYNSFSNSFAAKPDASLVKPFLVAKDAKNDRVIEARARIAEKIKPNDSNQNVEQNNSDKGGKHSDLKSNREIKNKLFNEWKKGKEGHD